MQCLVCQSPLDYGDLYCRRCGAPASERSEGPAEVRLMTVVAFRLPGYRAMLEAQPDVSTHPTLGTVVHRIRQHLDEQGALILGPADQDPDGGCAVFGAAGSSEDAASRALRAAVEARDIVRNASAAAWKEVGAPLELSVGVDSGKAAVYTSLDDAGLTVDGVPVQVATMLCRAAAADTILVDESTRQMVGRTFNLQRLEPLLFRRPATRMPVFRLELRAQHVRERPRRLLTGRFKRPLVGREEESLTIRQNLAQARSAGRLRRCLVRGETGSGVSRLVREVIAVLRGSRSNLTVAEADITGREGATVPFGILGKVVSSLATLDAAANLEDARVRLEAQLNLWHREARVQLDPFERSWLLHLAGVGEVSSAVAGDDPELMSEISHRAVVDLLRVLVKRGELLLVFEDVGLATDRELAVIERLLADLEELPVMALMTTSSPIADRPSFRARPERDSWVELGPLPEDAARVLVDEILGRREALPREIADAVIQHAKRNPLFIEETLTALTEAGLLVADGTTGAWTLEGGALPSGLPSTLEGLVAARIDHLPPGPASVLRKAAVVGDVFWRGLIEDLGEPEVTSNLTTLEAQGFVTRSYRSTLEGHVGYRFTHRIVRDVAFADVPEGEAKQLHARVARWLAVNAGERFSHWLGAIAWHFAMAADSGRALSYHLQAGAWARSRGDVGEAAFQFERARFVAPRVEVAMEAALELGEAYRFSGRLDEAEREFREVLAWAEEQGELRMSLRCLVQLARIANDAYRFEKAQREARRGLEVATRLGAARDEGHLHVELARAATATGHEQAAKKAAEKASALYDAAGSPQVDRARAVLEQARAALHLGRLEEALTAFSEARRKAVTLHHWVLVQRARHGTGWISFMHGLLDESESAFAATREAFMHVGHTRLHVIASLGLALVMIERSRFADAVNLAGEALVAAKQADLDAATAFAHAVLGHAIARASAAEEGLPADALSPTLSPLFEVTPEEHMTLGELGLRGAHPRFYRVFTAIFLAEHLLGDNPRSADGKAMLASAQELTEGFDPCQLVLRLMALED